MEIKQTEFIKSSTSISQCPPATIPEIAFIGRSNVGKSTLINMLANKKDLAKTSSTPGKTQTINHFFINKLWYLVDLPGYGYARISKSVKNKWEIFIREYLTKRENLKIIFVLIDIRHKPQKIDLDFLTWLGSKAFPFAIIFTKADKLKKGEAEKHLTIYKNTLLETWEELPLSFVSSATTKEGREDILNYIDNVISDK
ncbi:MAG: YihA family ribosome biogenesis GTP-binding protein [Bacteroidales bacterium]|nr:YihA family ribosome biogenesis GTP-binding protein [Bacteroidales bacterium]